MIANSPVNGKFELLYQLEPQYQMNKHLHFLKRPKEILQV